MAEDEAIFDPSLKKKKKKKKTPFDLDAALGGESTEVASGESEETQAKEEGGSEDISVDADLSLDFGGKKKKKKKPLDLGDLDDALPDGGGASQDTGGDVPLITDDDQFAFDNMKKKKKKKKEVNFTDQDLDLGQESKDEATLCSANSSKWANTDRDYTYDELVTRVFDIMREKNPEMVAGEKKKFVTKPPQVVKAGAKKTLFANFVDICKLLHRQPKHLLNFLLTELGTSGSLDGMNQLIIKGRFLQKQIESVLRSYIKEYVTCHTCRSPDTILQKDTRLYFLQCETCGSRCSVASIKSGFQAVTGKRAAMRAKNTT